MCRPTFQRSAPIGRPSSWLSTTSSTTRFAIPVKRKPYPCARQAQADHVRFDVIDRGVGHTRRRLAAGQAALRSRQDGAEVPGNGLGLAIVNRIAADHGGALEITSEVGRGTTGTLIIPKAAT